MHVAEEIQRALIRSIYDPELAFKIYDNLGSDANLEALLAIARQRKINEKGFAAVVFVYNFPDPAFAGPAVDLHLYGREGSAWTLDGHPRNPDVFPYCIRLADGRDLPPEYGCHCLEEEELFGLESKKWRMYRDGPDTLQKWLNDRKIELPS